VALRFHLKLYQLGLPLAGLGFGLAVGALALTGPITARFGSRFTLQAGILIWFTTIPCATIAPNPASLFGVLAGGGVGAALIDYGWYELSVEFERDTQPRRVPHLPKHVPSSRKVRRGAPTGPVPDCLQVQRRPVAARHTNQGLNVPYSPGALAGAAAAALGLKFGWHPFLVVGTVCGYGLVTSLGCSLLLPARPEGHRNGKARQRTRDGKRLWLERLRFAVLLIACWLVFLPLGITNVWSSLYMRTIGARGALITLGLTAYYIGATIGGTLAWHYSKRFQKAGIVVAGALLAIAGGLLIVVGATPWTATVGFGMIGVGLAPAGPYLQTRGAQLAEHGNPRVRKVIVNASTYVGGVVGQPLISLINRFTSLRFALLAIVAAALGVAASAPAAGGEHGETTESSPAG
jgi:MFS family permease